jgi:outer membrane receptor protein involved in Fe transport
VNEWNAGVWAQAERTFGPVRLTLGARYTGVGADVDSDDPLNSGSKTESTLSPKVTVAWQVSPQWELYADAGRGFHTNDARGAVETVVPGTSDPATPVPLIVPALGGEIGSRWSDGNWTATATVFWLHLDSELTYSGDASDTESSSATERLGGELLLNWHPIPRIDFDASAAVTHARYLDHPVDGDRIPNAIEYMVTGGVSALITDNLTATVTVRHLGPSPLTGDGLIKSRAATDTNLLLRYQWDRFTFTGEVLNVLDSKDDDIEYYYTSRLPAEPVDGVDDYHIHPMEPRTWRLGLRVAL